jgi:hypothetical protein
VEERAHAADLCWDCPVIFECRAMAEARGEVFGVYGGKDITKPGVLRTWEVVDHED